MAGLDSIQPSLVWVTLMFVVLLAVEDGNTDSISKRVPKPCPKFCSCRSSDKTAMCNGIRMQSIPKFPKFVQKVKFMGTNFPNITDRFVSNLRLNTTITRLDFINTNTSFIAPDAFELFENLTTLELSSNGKISPGTMSNVLKRMSVLNKIILTSNNWHTVPKSMFAGLQRSTLSDICLRNNSIESISGEYFSEVHSLKFLDLSENELTAFNATGLEFTNITKLMIHENNLLQFPSFCPSAGMSAGKYTYINVGVNPIYKLNQSSFQCLDHLKELWLNKISLRQLKNNAFANLPCLRKLILNDNGNHLQVIEPYAFNSSSLEILSFNKNGFKFDKKPLQYSKIFSLVPNLESLDLSNNHLSSNSKALYSMFSPLKKLKRLILQKTHLKVLPRNVFRNMPSLNSLILIGNYISGWNDDPAVFGNVTSIRALYLDGNNIKLINRTSFPEGFLQSLDEICLTNNPFSCTCDQMWFLDWLKSTKKTKIVNYPNRYTCRFPPEMNNKPLKEYNPTPELCSDIDKVLQKACIGISAVFIIGVLIVSLCYRYRFYLKYWLHVIGIRRLGYKRVSDEEDYIYDAFVIYCDEDLSFVKEHVLPELEERAGCNLCVHSRDFDVGGLIIDNITINFEKSKNIILILSDKFLKSEWCSYELALTQTRTCREGPGILTVILLEELDPRQLPSSVRAVLETVDYHLWSEHEASHRRFWGQVLTRLNRHNGTED